MMGRVKVVLLGGTGEKATSSSVEQVRRGLFMVTGKGVLVVRR
jgi:hypothetical protein